MAEASLKLGGSWATKEGSLLGFNDQNGNYKPIPFDFTRATTATRINRNGLIEEVQAGVPRIDFLDNPDGALLLEPQRTNLVTQSEYFGAWTNDTNISLTANAIESPSGYVDAYKMIAGTSTARQAITLNLSASGDIIQSFFAKKGEYSVIQITNARSATLYANFDLNNGVVGNYQDCTPSIEAYNNGWFKCVISYNSSLDILKTRISIAESPTQARLVNFAGNGSDGLYIWGAEVEVGSYPTSYIKTSGSAVTRNADVCENTSASDYIGQPNGSIFLDFVYDNNFGNTRIFSVSENSWISGGSIRLEKSTNKFRWNWVDNGAATGSLTSTTTMVVGTRYKIAITYTATSASLFLDGIKEDTSSVTTPTQMNQIHLNELGGGFTDANEFQRNIFNQVLVFPTALTDQEAIDLTTL